jgi:hypothetical protein
MSTNVGLFFAASFPPADSSGNPGRVLCCLLISLNLSKDFLKRFRVLIERTK